MLKKYSLIIATTFYALLPINISFGYDIKSGMSAYDNGDYDTAIYHFKPFAENGNPAAQISLGHSYYKKKYYEASAYWAKKSAKQGYAVAQNFLGMLYLWGQGVPKDYKLSLMWVLLGNVNGYKADWEKQAIATGLTPEEFEQVLLMSKRCLHSQYTQCGY